MKNVTCFQFTISIIITHCFQYCVYATAFIPIVHSVCCVHGTDAYTYSVLRCNMSCKVNTILFQFALYYPFPLVLRFLWKFFVYCFCIAFIDIILNWIWSMTLIGCKHIGNKILRHYRLMYMYPHVYACSGF